jgi:signal transduction histidine kinase/CheY-like chemotaxis protein
MLLPVMLITSRADNMKYWPEVFFLFVLLVVSMNGIKQYRHIEVLTHQLQVKNELEKSLVRLSLESIAISSQNIQHYDQHAQQLFTIDTLLQQLFKNEIYLVNQVTEFQEQTTHYLQIATTLKNSNKLVFSINQFISNAPPEFKSVVHELIVKINQYNANVSQSSTNEIRGFIKANNEILNQLDMFSVQWSMINLHIDFILNNTQQAERNIIEIKNNNIVDIIRESEKITAKDLSKQNHLFFISITFVIISLLLVFIIAMYRQSMQLKEKTIQAKQAAEEKSQFLANMSHEIRTPMNGIIGLSDILLGSKLNEFQQDFMEKLKFSAQSLMTIINDILDFSKIESKNLAIEEIDFSLEELLDNLKVLIGYSASNKGLELVFNIDHGLSSFYRGDPIRINQVLLNLLSNAIKFTESGSVSVTVKPVYLNDETVHVSFSVKDTGIGLSTEQQSRLFERFSQAESSTSRKYGGTGLGLAISKLLTELMHGEINFDSEFGKGSCFSITLPIDAVAAPTIPINDVATLVNTNLLLIEDHLLTQQATERLLKKRSINVDSVSSATQALEKLKKNHYDFILMDWCLPDMVGKQLLEKISELTNHSSEIIIFTAYDANQLDIDKQHVVLHKPLMLKDLTKALMHSYFAKQASVNTNAQPVPTPELDHIEESDSLNIGQPLKILFAEDNRINATIVLNILSSINAQVTHVENGQLAIDEVLNNHFNLILMDVQMPVMNGIEATEIIRQHYDQQQLPIIAFTANILPDEIALYKSKGITDHIGKPFEKAHLLSLIEQYS